MKVAFDNAGLMSIGQFLVKISAFVLVSVALLYFSKQWSDGDQQLLLFNYGQFTANITSQTLAPISPNYSKPLSDTTAIDEKNHTRTVVQNEEFVSTMQPELNSPNLISPSSPPFSSPPSIVASGNFSSQPPLPRPLIERFGIVDENGIMSNEFGIGDFDPKIVEDMRNGSGSEDVEMRSNDGGIGVGVKRFLQCSASMTDYIPCLDNVDAVKKLKSIARGQQFERHCPEKRKGLNCLIPRPQGYKRPVPWPKSRDEVWYINVPHMRLVEDKGAQNWISIAKNKFRFPGGGTQFIRADQYIDQISKMVPDIAFGQRTHVVMDVGCGVASFGAYLMSRNVLTLSVAPKDDNENQIQFALERGVPAMVAAFATHRLLYPSQAFDLVHCSRCQVDWTRDDGILLLELNRMLRAGGYFVWAAQPVYKHEVKFEEQWQVMADLTTRLCWELVKKEGFIAIWRKPLNNSCYLRRREGTQPPLCNTDDDPDNLWYADLKTCITRIPEKGYGANVSMWPMRLYNPPDRLETINIEASIARKELYKAESQYGDEIVGSFHKVIRWKKLQFRNILDMRAGFGGLAAALINQKIDCWVMNVVPVSGPNTLPVIYDRGLIGVMHDWCEPFDTYPRTYDFLHASVLFSVEQSRCDIGTIMLEMDRILRPGGFAYIHDSVIVIYKLKELGDAMGWHVKLRDTAEGPYASYKLLVCEKRLKQKK
ncbi:unnamed protein product [Rhodiola kirilowii]